MTTLVVPIEPCNVTLSHQSRPVAHHSAHSGSLGILVSPNVPDRVFAAYVRFRAPNLPRSNTAHLQDRFAGPGWEPHTHLTPHSSQLTDHLTSAPPRGAWSLIWLPASSLQKNDSAKVQEPMVAPRWMQYHNINRFGKLIKTFFVMFRFNR